MSIIRSTTVRSSSSRERQDQPMEKVLWFPARIAGCDYEAAQTHICCSFLHAPPTPGIYTLSLHDALPISSIFPIDSVTVSVLDDRTSLGASSCTACVYSVAATRAEPMPNARSGMNASFDSRCGSLTRRSEEHTSELQSQFHLVCRLLLEKK